MRKRVGKVGRTTLILFCGLSIISLILENRTKRRVFSAFYEEKVKAVELAKTAFSLVREERLRLGMGIDSINDPYLTGLIGSPTSPITSGRISLDEVLLTTGPNFAGILVSLLKREGIKSGETVLVFVDGSFPGLYLSFLAAFKVLFLNPFIIGSLTSNSWGANHPALTYLDMERVVRSAGLFPFATSFVSLGGEDDYGLGLSPFAREMLYLTGERNGVRFCDPKMKSSLAPKGARFFINIGNSPAANFFLSEAKRRRMKVFDFSRSKVRRFLEEEGIGEKDLFAPIGKGKIFEEERYSVGWTIFFIAVLLFALYFIIRYDIEFYLLSKKERERILEEEAI
jgi:poly-gamma-glutamate system protein